VLLRISQAGVDGCWDDVPTTLMRYCSQPVHHSAMAWIMAAPASSNLAGSRAYYSAAMASAQQELTATYKAKNSYLMRLAAWSAVLGLKVVKRLQSVKVRYHRREEGVEIHSIGKAKNRNVIGGPRGKSKVA
jgi:hypothetical protein